MELIQLVELRENILFLANQPVWVLKLIVALLHSAYKKYFRWYKMGSGGGEVVRVTALYSWGPELKSNWHQGFFLFFFYKQQSVLNQVPRLLFFLFPLKTLAVLPEAKQG